MTVSVPRFAIKLAGREHSRWNLLITQFKYTSTLPSKSSSKSKKSERSWRKAAELNDSVCADPDTQGQLPTMGGASGLEPARARVLSRPPLPIGLRAHGAGGRIRTDKHGGLSSADKPILVRRHNFGGPPRLRTGKISSF